jgi:cell division protein ZapA
LSRVTLMIGGRDYAVACAEGEEAHVAGLGQMIDAKLAELPSATAQSEVRSLLFAALLLADEVSELRHALPDPAAMPEAIPEPAPIRRRRPVQRPPQRHCPKAGTARQRAGRGRLSELLKGA